MSDAPYNLENAERFLGPMTRSMPPCCLPRGWIWLLPEFTIRPGDWVYWRRNSRDGWARALVSERDRSNVGEVGDRWVSRRFPEMIHLRQMSFDTLQRLQRFNPHIEASAFDLETGVERVRASDTDLPNYRWWPRTAEEEDVLLDQICTDELDRVQYDAVGHPRAPIKLVSTWSWVQTGSEIRHGDWIYLRRLGGFVQADINPFAAAPPKVRDGLWVARKMRGSNGASALAWEQNRIRGMTRLADSDRIRYLSDVGCYHIRRSLLPVRLEGEQVWLPIGAVIDSGDVVFADECPGGCYADTIYWDGCIVMAGDWVSRDLAMRECTLSAQRTNWSMAYTYEGRTVADRMRTRQTTSRAHRPGYTQLDSDSALRTVPSGSTPDRQRPSNSRSSQRSQGDSTQSPQPKPRTTPSESRRRLTL